MADIADVAKDLRSLARLIPVVTRELMTKFELTQRTEYVASLMAEADIASDERKAQSLRKKAHRVLNAISLESLTLESHKLNAALSDARLRGDDQQAMALYADLSRLERDNPQPPAGRVLAAAAVATMAIVESRIPPRRDSRLFRNKRS